MQEEVTQKTVTFCVRTTKMTADVLKKVIAAYLRHQKQKSAEKKDKTKDPPVYMVFFKGRDQDAITAAFREFSQKEIQKANRPSIHKRLAAYRGIVAGKTKGKARNKHQEVSR